MTTSTPRAVRPYHPLRNHVTRALGGTQSPVARISDEILLQPGDVLLLCSDGFWAAQPKEHLLELVQTASLQDCIDRLTSRAVANSAPDSDNVTLVALRTRGD